MNTGTVLQIFPAKLIDGVYGSDAIRSALVKFITLLQ